VADAPANREINRGWRLVAVNREINREFFDFGPFWGNFLILGLFLRCSLLIHEQVQTVTIKFPTQRNREFFRRNRECF
jgi:hypothetical protein